MITGGVSTTATLSPTLTGAIIATPEFTPTSTATGAATSVATSTATPTLTSTPWRRFVAYYNYNSFYLLNASRSNLEVERLAFERLDTSGQPLNRFDGLEWGVYNPTLPNQMCNRIEIRDNPPFLRPMECNNLYKVKLTPYRSAEYIFWSASQGSLEFRVLWDNQEMARCQIAAGVCVFWLP
jgi:hypothetical protein